LGQNWAKTLVVDALFPVVPSNYHECRNKDGNRQSKGEKCAFWKAHWREKRKRASLG
jgi:hypothetical protein